MIHLTDLQLSMHADGALAENEVAGLQSHIESCSVCHKRLIDYTEERRLIGTALQSDESVAVPDIELPRFKPPITLKSFAIANLVTGLAVWLGQFLWKTLFGELIMSAFTQITSLYVPDAYELMANAVLYLSEEGIVMLDNYIGYIALLIAVVTMVWLAASWRRAATGLVVLVATGLLLPVNDVEALEIRRSENMVSVEAAEVIEDTVIMVGDTIVIEGDVRGDLLTAGRRVVISGSVGGNLVALAETVSIHGDVGGFVASAASSVELGESTVGGDLWSASANTTLGRDTRITGNATIATELLSVAGQVGKDLHAFGETIEVSGKIAEDVEAFAAHLNLLGDAEIKGNVRFRTKSEDRLQRSPSASVDGTVEFLDLPEEMEPRSRYVTGKFYLWKALQLAGGFLFGLAVFWLIPGLRDLSINGGVEGLKTAGLGLIAMVSLPIVCIILAITLVGMPFAVVGFISWFVIAGFSKILVAEQVGQMVFAATGQDDSMPLTLLSGLVVVIVAINLPGIGGVISFILTILGAGLLVQMITDYVSELGE